MITFAGMLLSALIGVYCTITYFKYKVEKPLIELLAQVDRERIQDRLDYNIEHERYSIALSFVKYHAEANANAVSPAEMKLDALATLNAINKVK